MSRRLTAVPTTKKKFYEPDSATMPRYRRVARRVNDLSLPKGYYFAELAPNAGQTIYNDFNERQLSSYMLRAEYILNNKLFITATGRYDGTTVFRPGNQWGFFPSVAVAYSLSNLVANLPGITNFKLRAGWGQVGNQAIAPYSTFAQLRFNSYAFDGTSASAGRRDLVVTGEWMGIQVYLNENNALVKSSSFPSLANAVGWWNRLMFVDVDQDGDQDIVAGNLGLNYKFHASEDQPFHIYTDDFDYNGIEDIVLAKKYKGKQVPIRGKTCMTQQLPHLAQKIPSYQDFASRDVEGIVGQGLESALHYAATEFRSGIFMNNGEAGFKFSPFPISVQKSPIDSIVFEDLDSDGHQDLLLAGNNHQSEVETTRADAGTGAFLKGNGQGDFVEITPLETGFQADKDVRNMVSIDTPVGKFLVVVNNNDEHDMFKLNPPYDESLAKSED